MARGAIHGSTSKSDARTPVLRDVPVLIPCGGRGTRLGALAADRPKSLLELEDRPILWYLIGGLYLAGFRHLVLTLGYRGDEIRHWLAGEVRLPGLQIDALDTGTDAPIAHRIACGLQALPGASDLLITNGDTLVEADFGALYRSFVASDGDGLLLTVPAPSQFGVVVTEGDKVRDFVRSSQVRSLQIEHEGREQTARIYGGTAFLRREPLAAWLDAEGPEACESFEQDYYGALCRQGRMASRPLSGLWICFDTPKDFERASDPSLASRIVALRIRIESAFAKAIEPRPHPVPTTTVPPDYRRG